MSSSGRESGCGQDTGLTPWHPSLPHGRQAPSRDSRSWCCTRRWLCLVRQKPVRLALHVAAHLVLEFVRYHVHPPVSVTNIANSRQTAKSAAVSAPCYPSRDQRASCQRSDAQGRTPEDRNPRSPCRLPPDSRHRTGASAGDDGCEKFMRNTREVMGIMFNGDRVQHSPQAD